MTSTTERPAKERRPPSRPSTTGRRVQWTGVALTSLAIVGYVYYVYYVYAAGSLQTLAEREVGLATTYADRALQVQVQVQVQAAFYAHITFSALALAIGPLQFVRALRRRRPSVHRWIGRVFMESVAIGSVASFIMAFFNSEAINGFFGFGTLAVLWGYTAWRGWRAIRVGDHLSLDPPMGWG